MFPSNLARTTLVLCTFLTALSACSPQAEEVAPPNKVQENSAGPYDVVFDATTGIYQHNFELNIAQAEGKVDYYITVPEAMDILFVDTRLKVTGCPAAQVNHQTIWLPDSAVTSGQYLTIGTTFRTRPGVRGSFMHVLKGLSGCTTVNLTTTLQKKSLGLRCKESTDEACRVELYCKQTDPLASFIEVEVWKESWGLTLRKFMNHSDGTRNQMAMHSVTYNRGTSESTYTANASSDRSFLRVNNQTLIGLYSQDVGGTAYPTDVTCKIP